jgi:hypothetical protein
VVKKYMKNEWKGKSKLWGEGKWEYGWPVIGTLGLATF